MNGALTPIPSPPLHGLKTTCTTKAGREAFTCMVCKAGTEKGAPIVEAEGKDSRKSTPNQNQNQSTKETSVLQFLQCSQHQQP